MTSIRAVPTHGLTHVALAVRDPERSLAFYGAVLGAIPVYRDADFVQVQTPGSRDVLVFERDPRRAGRAGGVAHFGFRLKSPDDLPRALAAVEAAGGTIREHGSTKRRPLVRFFACEEDLSHEPPDAPLPDAVAAGREPFFIVGAIAGG